MSKYTPGPWRAFIRKRAKVIAILSQNGDAIVAWPGFDSSDYNISTQVHNARLIAAAPDLADVAHMVLNTATVYTPPELVQAATAALRKAGEI